MRHICAIALGILLPLTINANPLIPNDNPFSPVEINLEPLHRHMTENFSSITTENSLEFVMRHHPPPFIFICGVVSSDYVIPTNLKILYSLKFERDVD